MAKSLGRGLGSLLPDEEEASSINSTNQDGVKSLPLGQIKGNPNQPRKDFQEEPLKELAESIKEKGIIQPILVESLEDGTYQIVAGERRFRAAGLAGLTEVPVIVRSFTDEDRLEIALIENIQREDLTPIEESKAYRHLMEAFNLTQEEVAKKVGKQRSTVANALRLLKLPSDMQEALERNEITAGHARAILSIVNPADQRLLFSRIITNHLNVREAEDLSGQLNQGIRSESSEKPTSKSKGRSPELDHLEQKFVDALGTKVALKGNGKKGSLEIAYYSTDDLARLFEIFSSGKQLF